MNKSKLTKLIIVFAVVVGAFFLLPKFIIQDNTEDPGMVSQPSESETQLQDETQVQTPEEDDEEDNVRVFEIEGFNYDFSIKEIKVNKGDKVKIVFTSTEGFHNWVVDEFSATTKDLSAGESDTIEFLADETGTFEYYCSIGSHRALGMIGTLIVE